MPNRFHTNVYAKLRPSYVGDNVQAKGQLYEAFQNKYEQGKQLIDKGHNTINSVKNYKQQEVVDAATEDFDKVQDEIKKKGDNYEDYVDRVPEMVQNINDKYNLGLVTKNYERAKEYIKKVKESDHPEERKQELIKEFHQNNSFINNDGDYIQPEPINTPMDAPAHVKISESIVDRGAKIVDRYFNIKEDGSFVSTQNISGTDIAKGQGVSPERVRAVVQQMITNDTNLNRNIDLQAKANLNKMFPSSEDIGYNDLLNFYESANNLEKYELSPAELEEHLKQNPQISLNPEVYDKDNPSAYNRYLAYQIQKNSDIENYMDEASTTLSYLKFDKLEQDENAQKIREERRKKAIKKQQEFKSLQNSSVNRNDETYLTNAKDRRATISKMENEIDKLESQPYSKEKSSKIRQLRNDKKELEEHGKIRMSKNIDHALANSNEFDEDVDDFDSLVDDKFNNLLYHAFKREHGDYYGVPEFIEKGFKIKSEDVKGGDYVKPSTFQQGKEILKEELIQQGVDLSPNEENQDVNLSSVFKLTGAGKWEYKPENEKGEQIVPEEKIIRALKNTKEKIKEEYIRDVEDAVLGYDDLRFDDTKNIVEGLKKYKEKNGGFINDPQVIMRPTKYEGSDDEFNAMIDEQNGIINNIKETLIGASSAFKITNPAGRETQKNLQQYIEDKYGWSSNLEGDAIKSIGIKTDVSDEGKYQFTIELDGSKLNRRSESPGNSIINVAVEEDAIKGNMSNMLFNQIQFYSKNIKFLGDDDKQHLTNLTDLYAEVSGIKQESNAKLGSLSEGQDTNLEISGGNQEPETYNVTKWNGNYIPFLLDEDGDKWVYANTNTRTNADGTVSARGSRLVPVEDVFDMNEDGSLSKNFKADSSLVPVNYSSYHKLTNELVKSSFISNNRPVGRVEDLEQEYVKNNTYVDIKDTRTLIEKSKPSSLGFNGTHLASFNGIKGRNINKNSTPYISNKVNGQLVADFITKRDLVVTSGYRNKKQNKEAGGKDDSNHLDGTSIDISIQSKEALKLRNILAAKNKGDKSAKDFINSIKEKYNIKNIIDEGNHLHINFKTK